MLAFFCSGLGSLFLCVFRIFLNALVCVALSHPFFLFRIFSSHSTQPQQEVAQKWQSRKKKKTVRFKEGERKKKKVDSFNLALSSLSLNVKAELCWERKQFPFFFFQISPLCKRAAMKVKCHVASRAIPELCITHCVGFRAWRPLTSLSFFFFSDMCVQFFILFFSPRLRRFVTALRFFFFHTFVIHLTKSQPELSTTFHHRAHA